MKILLAVDGSQNSNDAVRLVVNRVPWFRDSLTIDLIYVHRPLPPVGSLLGNPLSQKTINQYYQDEAQEHLAEPKRILNDAGQSFETHVVVGEPATEICNFAVTHHCDWIFIGSRGMGAIGNLVLGSTATKVVHLAKVPVVIVPLKSSE